MWVCVCVCVCVCVSVCGMSFCLCLFVCCVYSYVGGVCFYGTDLLVGYVSVCGMCVHACEHMWTLC